MNLHLISRLIRFNRTLSWLLVVLTSITILSGYGITRDLFYIRFTPFWFLIREIHLLINWFYISLLTLHIIIIEMSTRFKWAQILQNLRTRWGDSILWLKIIQKISGMAILIVSILAILSGLNWYIISIVYILPLYQHVRFDIFLIVAIIIHTAIGSKFALTRRGFNGHIVDAFIIFISLILIILSISVDRNLLVSLSF